MRIRCRPPRGTARQLTRDAALVRVERKASGALILIAAAATFGVAGCGGGGGGSTPTPTPTPTQTPVVLPTPTPTPTPGPPTKAKLTITWAARSRDVVPGIPVGPSAALSATITLQGGATDGTDLVWTANRDTTNIAEQQATYTSTGLTQPGQSHFISVKFYSQPNGQGSLVGKDETLVNVANDGTIVGTFVPIGYIAKIVIPNQTVVVGEPQDLQFQALDSSGNDLHVTPGSVFFQVLGGGSNLSVTQGGTATGLHPGTATVNASPDQTLSPPATITITSRAVVGITPSNDPTISLQEQQQFNASVTGIPNGSDTSVTWSVVDSSGNAITDGSAGSIDANGLYTAPKSEGTFNIKATSNFDTQKSTTVQITVRSLVGVTIGVNPPAQIQNNSVDVVINNTLQFTSSVSHIPSGQDSGVVWAVVDANGNAITGTSSGTITKDGLYTAPSTRGTYYVQATSNYDTTKFSRIKINAQAGNVPIVVQ